ncbi:MAG TPA: LytTR family DNA-binding domain-containing protein [Myxococcaceae bacterium]|nr:LytTR family DNA-binding domain-containing protein [Myxococcaceae bacterium]
MTLTSTRLRALVVDDEPLARRTLCELLERERDVEVVGVCGDGSTATEAIRSGRPDLLFLDVQMPELDGFGVLRAVRDVQVPAVVFVTAFGEHAVRAFDEEATDYLVKPFDDDRFGRALERARSRIEAVRRESSPEPGPSRWLERFAVDCAGRISIIPVDTVEWIEAQDYYVQIHAEGKEHLLRESLRNLETRLDPRRFARVHRSAIVNVECVKQLRRRTHGEYVLVLGDGTELKLSRTHRDQLQLLLGMR